MKRFALLLSLAQCAGPALPPPTAFAALPAVVVPLNMDAAGNNVRTLRRIKAVLDDRRRLRGKAYSEFKLLGLARDGDYTALARGLRGRPVEEIARGWATWLKQAPAEELAAASPSGRLAQARVAFDAFWAMPVDVCAYFLAHATDPDAQTRLRLQAIELLANSGRGATPTMADVDDVAGRLRTKGGLPDPVRDYLDNKGARGWGEPDRVLVLKAWRDG